jgi:superfamily II DNA or RNA helicase
MPSSGFLVSKPDLPYSCAVLREHDEWGLRTVDLVHPPRRFWSDEDSQPNVVEEGIDLRRVQRVLSPAEILPSLPPGENWQSLGRRSMARFHAYYLLAEDPQRRLDVREVETLAHQVSLVRHVLQSENLQRVLIADEVGLGKTIEVGLILQELLAQRPGLRVLYLAPARLVSNVRREFDRLKLAFRQWTAYDGDARLSDPRIIASIHRAVHGNNLERLLNTAPWDIVIVDECHHLSAWSPDGTDPGEAYRLVRGLISQQPSNGRVVLMSGTPHQGHRTRFENLLRFLRAEDEPPESLSGRVIFRTKDDIRDWDGNPVFPSRQVNEPRIVDLGPRHRQWIQNIHDFYRPPHDTYCMADSRRRAAGWRCAQAMQWAASSPHAGLGYLVRQAVRAGWDLRNRTLSDALAALRPYRLGSEDEPVERLFDRITKEVDKQQIDADIEDIEDFVPGQDRDWLSSRGLQDLIGEGITLVRKSGDDKWEIIDTELLAQAGSEKVVLFAQPIERVTSLARFLERRHSVRPALIIGGQSDAERAAQVASFWAADGPQYLVSSRAGGEGINLQVAHRLVHIDVPWNPMDMEQRVGRIHRFGSRETIIVDTLVVKDSREADAYRIAREKLKLITATLVEREKFESVYSRVMCLMPQDELQSVLLNAPGAPLNAEDEQRLSEMVQQGFKSWKEFHDRFGEQQKSIRSQDPGLCNWEDVAFFLEELGGAKRQPGFTRQRFQRKGNAVARVNEEAVVLQVRDGANYVCANYGEELVFGPGNSITPKVGLNVKDMAELLRKYAFPAAAVGAAYLRWPVGAKRPSCVGELPFGVMVLFRQTLRMDRSGGWLDVGNAILTFVVKGGARITACDGLDKGGLIRGLLRATVRKSAEPAEELICAIQVAERDLVAELRRPTEDELTNQIRHAVTPLLAAIMTE